MIDLAKEFTQDNNLSPKDMEALISSYRDEGVALLLREKANELRRKYYQDKVYVRGLIEFTNYCKNNCLYCGIRRDNKELERYRLTKDEILSCCHKGYDLGFRTFVLQGGEDYSYSDKDICDIVYQIKSKYPDCAVTLSIGERSYESYKAYKDAGADRYLLRHETAGREHYKRLHPSDMSYDNRKKCLYNLKELGYQTGAGFMVGSPYQTISDLASDVTFLKELQPEMVGIGPFIPHHATMFAHEETGSIELSLFMISVIRILLPKALIPATTALGTISADGREKGLLSGANVVMPNLSPVVNRKMYELYDNKICTNEEAAECMMCLSRRVKSVGFEITCDRGDAVS